MGKKLALVVVAPMPGLGKTFLLWMINSVLEQLEIDDSDNYPTIHHISSDTHMKGMNPTDRNDKQVAAQAFEEEIRTAKAEASLLLIDKGHQSADIRRRTVQAIQHEEQTHEIVYLVLDTPPDQRMVTAINRLPGRGKHHHTLKYTNAGDMSKILNGFKNSFEPLSDTERGAAAASIDVNVRQPREDVLRAALKKLAPILDIPELTALLGEKSALNAALTQAVADAKAKELAIN